ncbi:hypothetical protein C4D60_Mb11t21880 [Musa balbisiana]|uniref:Uncharacterized protein n=1 Tax=Musa balbisiana TaxID=52838 RepID=A0A4S8J5X8_MUSBA|nr:hypothetical protein C4D60_Mb11t21880 [Musa balbisiana]
MDLVIGAHRDRLLLIIRCSFFRKQEALGFAPFGYYGLGIAPFSYCTLLASQVRLPNALPRIKDIWRYCHLTSFSNTRSPLFFLPKNCCITPACLA